MEERQMYMMLVAMFIGMAILSQDVRSSIFLFVLAIIYFIGMLIFTKLEHKREEEENNIPKIG